MEVIAESYRMRRRSAALAHFAILGDMGSRDLAARMGIELCESSGLIGQLIRMGLLTRANAKSAKPPIYRLKSAPVNARLSAPSCDHIHGDDYHGITSDSAATDRPDRR